MEIRGRDLVSGLPMTIEINSIHIREALAEPVGSIINSIKQTLRQPSRTGCGYHGIRHYADRRRRASARTG